MCSSDLLETVIPDETGVLFEGGDPASLAAALDRVAARPFAPDRVRRHAERFARPRFDEQMGALIADTLASPAGRRW